MVLYLLIVLAMLAATVFFGWRRLGSIGRRRVLLVFGVGVFGLMGLGWYVSTIDGRVIRNCIAEAMVRSNLKPLRPDEFIEITFPDGDGTVHFRVPADYVYFANNKEDGLGDRLILQVRLPDFIAERLAKHQSRPDCTEVTGSPLFRDQNSIEIQIRRGKDFWIRRKLEMNILPPQVEEELEIVHGLFSLGQMVHPKTGELMGRTFIPYEGGVKAVPQIGRDYYVPIGQLNSGLGIYAYCLRLDGGKFGGCRFHMDLSIGLYAEISIKRAKLSEWKEIVESSREFIEVFIVAQGEQPTDRS